MGIYLPNTEMPQNCGECLFKHLSPTGESLVCDISLSTVSWNERPFDCPLIPVPPHGRLIDADALLKKCEFACTDDDVDVRVVRYSVIEAAPTIIPASGGKEDE